MGWCRITPRAAVPAPDRPWRLRQVDTVPVWAIACFYVRKGHRRQGVMSALVDAAVALARFTEVARRSPERPILRLLP